MKTQSRYLKIILFLTICLVLLCGFPFAFGGRPVNVNGFMKQDRIKGGEGWVNYSFKENNNLDIISNVDLDVDLQFNAQLKNRHISFNVTDSASATITIDTQLFSERFSQNKIKQARNRYQNRWGSYIHIQTNRSIDILEISVIVNESQLVASDAIWAIYNETEGWTLLNTVQSDESVNTTITSTPTDIFLSVFAPVLNTTPFILIGSIVGVVIISLTILMSKAEYREYVRNRIIRQPMKYTLSIDDVLENENRSKIIDLIIDSPGIHFNELLRQTELSPGNLVWHLDVLETYRIIGKKNVGQYLIYFPYYEHNPMSNINIKLSKSDTTLQILSLIEENPGTYANEIADKLDLDHKTVKYHIEKLKENELIEDKKIGRKKLLYPHLNINKLYKNNN
ncbi:MAG: winged helix-turn-helix transcriptional regulator [Candidatus Lokiarchaeota archaeon]|nr:winged helix-turn-helix transcriptional regulator [Candidatus Lokiarchaeota archaeon]